MADRYWVSGGTGNYNSTTNWSATSGGASGASVPGTADNVFFNASSGVGTANINVASNCANLNLTGFTGTLSFTNQLTVNGTVLNLGTGGYTISGSANLRLLTAMTITNNGTTYTGNIEFAGTIAYTLADNMTCSGAVTLSSNGNQVINGNTLNIAGNFNCNNNLSATTSGTTNFVLTGTGTWTCLNPTNTTGNLRNNLTINTAGTLTISGTVNKGGGTFTYTAGTIIDTGATLALGGSTTTTLNISGKTFEKLLIGGQVTLSSNVNATTFGTWSNNSISFTLGAFSLNFTHLELGNSSTTTLPSAWVCQNIELKSGGTINSNSITINGNIVQSGTGILNGTTTMIYAGTGTWSRTNTIYFTTAFTINTAGTLTFSGGSIGSGIFTYTAGTVNVLPGSVLYIRGTGTTMNHGSIVWYDVLLGSSLGSGSIPNITLNNKLICSNSLSLGISNTAFGGTDATFDVYDLYFGSTGLASSNTSLNSGKNYVVRRLVQSQQSNAAFPITLKTNLAGVQAKFTVIQGASLNMGFINATDIDSSLGRPIYSYRGVFSNTLNWGLLPTDNIRSSKSIFVLG